MSPGGHKGGAKAPPPTYSPDERAHWFELYMQQPVPRSAKYVRTQLKVERGSKESWAGLPDVAAINREAAEDDWARRAVVLDGETFRQKIAETARQVLAGEIDLQHELTVFAALAIPRAVQNLHRIAPGDLIRMTDLALRLVALLRGDPTEIVKVYTAETGRDRSAELLAFNKVIEGEVLPAMRAIGKTNGHGSNGNGALDPAPRGNGHSSH